MIELSNEVKPLEFEVEEFTDRVGRTYIASKIGCCAESLENYI
jgi:hypothetical protein